MPPDNQHLLIVNRQQCLEQAKCELNKYLETFVYEKDEFERCFKIILEVIERLDGELG